MRHVIAGDLGELGAIFRWVRDAGHLEGFLTLGAGPAQPAVQMATLVTTPGIFVRYLQLSPDLQDPGLRLVDKGRV